nr:hypothetical protein [Actinomyces bowdenii]
MRVRAEQEAVTVGPYVDPAFSPCLECATAGDPEPGPAPEPARQDLAVGMAARAVAALIARATITHLPGDVRRTDLETLSTTERPVVTRPGCPVCSISGGPPKNPQEGRRAEQSLPSEPSGPGAGLAPVGARYEQSVAIPPAAFVDSKGHQQHYKPSNLRLQHEFRDWPTAARTPLPPPTSVLWTSPGPPVTTAARGLSASKTARMTRMPGPRALAGLLHWRSWPRSWRCASACVSPWPLVPSRQRRRPGPSCAGGPPPGATSARSPPTSWCPARPSRPSWAPPVPSARPPPRPPVARPLPAPTSTSSATTPWPGWGLRRSCPTTSACAWS